MDVAIVWKVENEWKDFLDFFKLCCSSRSVRTQDLWKSENIRDSGSNWLQYFFILEISSGLNKCSEGW
jgi:hypothetical protein